jgi:hypothetical protein
VAVSAAVLHEGAVGQRLLLGVDNCS